MTTQAKREERTCPNHPGIPAAGPSSNLCGSCLMGRTLTGREPQAPPLAPRIVAKCEPGCFYCANGEQHPSEPPAVPIFGCWDCYDDPKDNPLPQSRIAWHRAAGHDVREVTNEKSS